LREAEQGDFEAAQKRLNATKGLKEMDINVQ